MNIRRLADLILIREKDISTGANTYIAAVPGNSLGFIRDELCYVEKVDNHSFTFFRAMDGKRYTMSEADLSNFKLVGRK